MNQHNPTITQTEFESRVIAPADFVADAAAFVDVRLPKSRGKLSYSFIGPGVSQNPDQTVNVTEPHGFNIGAAAMDAGVVNSPHMHFTAEVFICQSGRWRFDIGAEGQQSIEIGPGDVFSVPTWVFRGFTNIGDDTGFVYTVLGGNETGGIVWAPSVLREAAETGLYLSRSGAVVEAEPGQAPSDVIEPLTKAELAAIDSYSDEELRERLVTPGDLAWSERALLSSISDGHRCRVAPVIGFGITEDRSQRAPIVTRHGFSVDWLEIGPGASTGRHRTEQPQVLIVFGEGAHVALGPDGSVGRTVENGAIVSVPAGAWRDYSNAAESAVRLLVVSASDAAPELEWSDEIVAAAREAGWVLDANGCIAPSTVISGQGNASR